MNTVFTLGLEIMGRRKMRKFKDALRDPRKTQLDLLRTILSENRNTAFGKECDFTSIADVDVFRDRISIADYENRRRYFSRILSGESDVLFPGRPLYYATTSGSAGEPKFVPVNREVVRHAHADPAKIYLYGLYREHPEALSGKILTLVSPAEEGTASDGLPYGSTSGQFVKGLGRFTSMQYAVPYLVHTIADHESRYYAILLLSMRKNVTLLSTANPSTLVLLAERAERHRAKLIRDLRQGTVDSTFTYAPDVRAYFEKVLRPEPILASELEAATAREGVLRPRAFWPNLKLIACWTGGSCATYLPRLREYYGDLPLRDLGFLATEIRGTIPLGSGTKFGAPTLDQNFFEFIEVEKAELGETRTNLLHEVEEGKRYYIYFTNRAGLYRYNIHDIVEIGPKVAGTPTLAFVQKGRGVTNITGEKLYERQAQTAIQTALERKNIRSKFHLLYANVEKRGYELFIEFEDASLSAAAKSGFITQVECALQTENLEYAGKRKSGRLEGLTLIELGPDSFQRFKDWSVSRGIREGQFKAPILTDDSFAISSIQEGRI